jgi:hypothetical protein
MLQVLPLDKLQILPENRNYVFQLRLSLFLYYLMHLVV